jgi:GNAT superfamily N-acetyltransferase
MRIEHIGPLPEATWNALAGDEEDPFGAAGETIEWAPKDLFTVLYEGERPVAATGLVVASTDRGDVAGVGGVIVTRSYRGRGLLRSVLEPALERAATLGPDTAMLFCSEANLARYGRFGFAEIRAPVIVDQPGGRREMPPHAMWRPLRDGAAWTDGPVRVRGLPF